MKILSSFLTLSLFTLIGCLPLVIFNPSQKSNSVFISEGNVIDTQQVTLRELN